MSTPGKPYLVANLISGDEVVISGIYRVQHLGDHVRPAEAVLIKGMKLPACAECGAVTFKLVRAAPTPAEEPDQWCPPKK